MMHDAEHSRTQARTAVLSTYFVEATICVVLIVVFVFMFVHALEWSLEAGLFPRIVSGFGVASVSIYLCQLTWHRIRNSAAGARRILDIPWTKVGGDQTKLKKQAFGIVAWAVAFWLGVVLVGFHVAAPAYLFSQLIIYGEVRVWIAAVGAGLGLLLIDVVYDRLAGTTWNDPVLFDLVKALF
ncbi:MAG: hypothetical protein GEU76_15870 [Alphaproteobacteria bacterium]|jgi:hypothetical protein|nr:hypothetical protein [Alphaproteobacteria bacterium]